MINANRCGVEIFVRAYRAAMALAIIAAIVAQFRHSSPLPTFNPGNFFSFFTIQGNIIAAAVLIFGAIRPALNNPRWDLIRGAATTYMFTVGVVFALLLADLTEQLGTTMPWVNSVLHQIAPIVVLIDWLIQPPRNLVKLPQAWAWLAYPILWLIYTLIRGPIADWYPYPFVDPRPAGYPHVIKACFAIAIGIIGFMFTVIWSGNSMRRLLGRRARSGGSVDHELEGGDTPPTRTLSS